MTDRLETPDVMGLESLPNCPRTSGTMVLEITMGPLASLLGKSESVAL